MARFRFLVLGTILMLAVPLLAACGSAGGGSATPTAGKTIKVCLITDKGGLNDKSFNHLADVGFEKAKSQLGITGTVEESHSANDYAPNLQLCATGNYDLVIAVGFDLAQQVAITSAQFPNVHFALIDSVPLDANFAPVVRSNVIALLFREQEAGALVGMVAGTLEKDGMAPKHNHVIGAVGGESIPPVNHYIAGYKWAATMADPSIKVLIGYSNNFADPSKCTGIASSQIGQGADILFQVAGGCGNGVLQAAGKAHVDSIGVDADQGYVDPSVIASALKHVDVATFDAIKFIKDGTLPQDYQAQGEAPCDAASRTCSEFLFHLTNNGVGYVVDNNFNLPSDVQSAVQTLQQQILSGQATPPDTIP
jgi:basic membrane protein A